jgi:hypothetical protein
MTHQQHQAMMFRSNREENRVANAGGMKLD